ncbi:MAG: inverse autotransporter beta domain-containing protein [Simkaniaceae bacterium]|nr:inverse autotransporter beta domain-containing protein [Simkaniaceae bacterium]
MRKLGFALVIFSAAFAEYKELIPTPERLRDVEVGLQFVTNEKPTYYIETIQSLYQTDKSLRHTVFIQPRTSYTNYVTTSNVGFGYRYLFPNNNWLIGFDTFYDLRWKRYFQRVGVGAAVYNTWFFFRANYYQKLTGIKAGERAMSGSDLEIEVPIPMLPWARFAGTYYFFDAK